jgi:chromosome segregation protein
MEDLKKNRARLSSMRQDMEDRLQEMRKRYDDLLALRSELSGEATVTAERVEAEREAHLARKEALVREEEVAETARSRVEDLRVVEREVEVKIEALADKARSELRLDLEAEFEAAVADMEADRDWEAVAAEIEEIRERLARMGNVNLEAIHELEEVEARYASLMEQREDLRKSIKNLEDLIASLNKESRTKFVETFEAVRKHFNEIFRKLFQGGRADLRLREGEDVLEAGVEIIAGPPGKEVRSINLLSGGEKTLTAVGLLFALFKSRPSPFCILDEVDAALDEVNIERFCSLLGEYVNDSQFIIVTHSKRTMSYCDFLYGITMQESGISTRIALNLEAYEDRVA